MNKSIVAVPGSLEQVAKQNNQSIAETFVSADVIVLVDTSSSMANRDSLNGLSRYEMACQELKKLQGSLPGRIAVISFSSQQVFCPNGQPIDLSASTMLAEALQFVKVADIPPMRFIVISDGYPEGALKVAHQFQNRIDTIHIGLETDQAGIEFLKKLANVKDGQSKRAGQAIDLAQTATRLLSS
jgi:hypothetical protein